MSVLRREPAAPVYWRPPMALTPGTRLGVYDVTTQTGTGGLKGVFQAGSTRDEVIVAQEDDDEDDDDDDEDEDEDEDEDDDDDDHDDEIYY